jgi:hypothetical protein
VRWMDKGNPVYLPHYKSGLYKYREVITKYDLDKKLLTDGGT